MIVNMVATLDGKIQNERTAKGLGSPHDQRLMNVIRSQVDAVLIGMGSLRADAKTHYSQPIWRATLSATGDVDAGHIFFNEAPEKTVLFLGPSAREPRLPGGVTTVRCGPNAPEEAVRWFADRARTLLVEGGAKLNGALFHAGLVDELFLTLAPKIRGGDGPSIATYSPAELREMSLVSVWEAEGELFLRYRFQTTNPR